MTFRFSLVARTSRCMKLFPTCLVPACMLLLIACHTKQDKTLFELAGNTGIHFENNVEDGKVENSFGHGVDGNRTE